MKEANTTSLKSEAALEQTRRDMLVSERDRMCQTDSLEQYQQELAAMRQEIEERTQRAQTQSDELARENRDLQARLNAT